MRLRLALICATVSIATPCVAQEPDVPIRIDLLHEQQWLEDRPDWRSTTIAVGQSYPRTFSWSVSVDRAERFGSTDVSGGVALGIPLSQSATVNLQAEAAPDPDFSAEWGAGAGLDIAFGDGWVTGIRGSFRSYPVADVLLGSANIEKYFGPWRAAYFVLAANGTGDSTGLSHSLRLSRYWGDRARVNLAGFVGEEVETVGNGRALILEAQGFDAAAEIPVGGRFDLLLGGSFNDHETLGARIGARAGLRTLF